MTHGSPEGQRAIASVSKQPFNRRPCPRVVSALLCCFVLTISAFAVPDILVDGVIHDSSGAVVPSAIVILRSQSFLASTRSDEHGIFNFHNVLGVSGTIEVRVPGFATMQQSWKVENGDAAHLDIILSPGSARESIVVSATRTDLPFSDTPGSTILFSSLDLPAIPALRVDDVLRLVPGFSLFRRSGSRTANASAQGVSLRGLGGSASSRALVMMDGISLVDPFGGWVNWNRVPRVALSSVEVFRGGSSNLYGSSALGGVVQFLTIQPEAPALVLEMSYGNENTPDLSLWTGGRFHQWDFSGTTEMFRSDGFILVPDSIRGSIDTAANSRNATVYARLGHSLGQNGRVFLRGNLFVESRNNGTQIQTNDTHIGEGAAGIDKQLGASDSLTLRLYGDVESYNQTFSAVAPDRNSETLTDLQHVPEQVIGGGAQWTHLLGGTHTLLAGLDFSSVIGASDERLFTGPNQARNAGGRQRTVGFFAEDIFRYGRWTAILGARVDDWNNSRGKLTAFPVSAPPVETNYPDRTEVAFSPRLSVLRALTNHVSVTGAIYRAFRAPTLNELYRTFRVGNVLTSNNPALNAERLTGAEAGVNVTAWNSRLSTRGTFFWSDIVDPVANVTLTTTPTLITRQKQNLGRTRSRGLELDTTLRVSRNLQLSAGYAYTDATVVSYPGNPGGIDLVGLMIPQVPRNVFTWQARYWNPSQIFVSATGRFVGRQFDDDQNQFPLDRFYAMDLELGRALTHHLEVFSAIENLTNQRYQVARTPTLNLGPPILFRFGMRLNYPSK